MKEEATGLAQTVVQGDAAGAAKVAVEDAGLVGAHLDHFVVERLLGRGGMGEVYAGTDESLDRPVAIKVLRGEVLKQVGMRDRFLREARAQARFNHPNIVQIHYIGRRPTPSGEESLYFAMERIDGGDLESLLQTGTKLTPEEARQAMIQVAQGLRAAHRAGVIHRDIKPSNLMLGPDGVIKIADFGLAKPVDGDKQITQEGAMVGSPYYIAPEQAVGDDLDHRADMYAMGGCFYHLLSGKPPFDGPRPMNVIAKHITEPLVPLTKVAPHVPPPLARVVERLLAKKPADRYVDYDALIADLESAAPERRTYAPLTTRAVSVLGDFLVASLLVGVADWTGYGWIGLVLSLVLMTVGHAWRGQTLAKYLLGIEVRRDDGSPLGLGRAVGRTLLSLWMPILAGVTIALTSGTRELLEKIDSIGTAHLADVRALLFATAISQGFLTLLYVAGLGLALFHPKKKTVHDLVVGSVVTYRFKPDVAAPKRGKSAPSLATPKLEQLAKKLSERPPPPPSAA